MGWWSTEVLGGDTPLDFIEFFSRTFFKNKELLNIETPNKAIPEILTQKQNQIIASIPERVVEWGFAKRSKDFTDNVSVGHQVVTRLMIDHSIEISRGNKTKLLVSIQKDDWANEDKERRKVINELVKELMNYK